MTNPSYPLDSHLDCETCHAKIKALQQENEDLKIALATVSEHGDIIESELHETNQKLKAEVAIRLQAESTLKALLEVLSREKDDLEIIVQTIMEHGDVLDNQWYQKFNAIIHQVGVDSLTQLPNRRRFDEYFAQAWHQAIADETHLAIIMCDLDAFKHYNDTYGHVAGDDCLKQVARVFQRCMRHSGDLIARYGGEEFVAVLPQTGLAGAQLVAERIQALIYEMNLPHPTAQGCERVTVSIGIAVLDPAQPCSQEALLQLADERLYQAKRRGRNCIISQ